MTDVFQWLLLLHGVLFGLLIFDTARHWRRDRSALRGNVARLLWQAGFVLSMLSVVLGRAKGTSLLEGLTIFAGLVCLITGITLSVRQNPEYWNQHIGWQPPKRRERLPAGGEGASSGSKPA